MRWVLAASTWLPDNVTLTVRPSSGAGFLWLPTGILRCGRDGCLLPGPRRRNRGSFGVHVCQGASKNRACSGKARFQSRPSGISFDAAGNLYIADSGNSVIRMVTSAGVIFTYAGTGVPGYSGDGGRAPSAHLHSVSDVSAGFMGNMYIDDVINNGIRRAGPNISSVASGRWRSRNRPGVVLERDQIAGACSCPLPAISVGTVAPAPIIWG
jgi:hypothetical protein